MNRAGEARTERQSQNSDGMSEMAYTDFEMREASRSLSGNPSGEDLYQLGLIYSAGEGECSDYVEAHKWFNLAALMGNDAAKTYRAELAQEMSSNEIAAAQRAAREWLSTRPARTIGRAH